MFNIGMMELILILLVAFLVVGPKDLPKVARWIARQVKSIRKFIREVKKETGWDSFAAELKETEADVKRTFKEATDEVEDAAREVKSAAEEARDAVQGVQKDVKDVTDSIRKETL